MTANIRILLAQIATFEAQHKAGLNPPVTALAEFFDQARLCRLDLQALDRDLVETRPAMRVAHATHATTRWPPVFERIGDRAVPIAAVARVLLDELGRGEVPPGAL